MLHLLAIYISSSITYIRGKHLETLYFISSDTPRLVVNLEGGLRKL